MAMLCIRFSMLVIYLALASSAAPLTFHGTQTADDQGVVLIQKRADVVTQQSPVKFSDWVASTKASDGNAAPKKATNALSPEFIRGQNNTNGCPAGFKGIGDENTCRRAGRFLSLHFDRKDSSENYPAGCFIKLSGEVLLNNNRGNPRAGHAPLCERDFVLNEAVEARDNADSWFNATIIGGRSLNGSYDIKLSDGSVFKGVWEFELRRRNELAESDAKYSTTTGTAALTDSSTKDKLRVNVPNLYETRDSDGDWWPMTILGNDDQDTDRLKVRLADGSVSSVYRENIRLASPSNSSASSTHDGAPAFILGANSTNSCPPGFKGIGDEQTCREAVHFLKLRYSRKDAWDSFPAGCFIRPNGEVLLNNNTGSAHKESAPLCERELLAKDKIEARDSEDKWWSATVLSSRSPQSTYRIRLDDGSTVPKVWEYNLRRVRDRSKVASAATEGIQKSRELVEEQRLGK